MKSSIPKLNVQPELLRAKPHPMPKTLRLRPERTPPPLANASSAKPLRIQRLAPLASDAMRALPPKERPSKRARQELRHALRQCRPFLHSAVALFSIHEPKRVAGMV